MPTFEERVWVDIDISIDEFLDSCEDYELEEIKEELERRNIIINTTGSPTTAWDIEWNNSITKLFNSRHLLTSEEEELILRITNKIL